MKCKACDVSIVNPVFDLGNTAIANNLISKSKLNNVEKTYPLVLYVCPKCFLVQTEQYLDGGEIFDEDYVYFSSYSEHWLLHAKKYTESIIEKLDLNKSSFVIEVASNDGYLLKNFVDLGIDCLGIEPTKGTAIEAISKGIPTLIEFFNVNLANRLCAEGKKADLVIANNVLAHVPDINNFIRSFKKVLKEGGSITIEFPHVLALIENNEFDTIYHEHFFYFSLYSLCNIFKKHGLSIYDVDKLSTHGGSLRIYITHLGNNIDTGKKKNNVERVVKEELEYGIDTLEYYDSLKENAIRIKLNSLRYLIEEKVKGKKIIAFGAAAKGNTFLNYCGIDRDIIDFVVDETPYKIGKYMPQSKIPILPFDAIQKNKPDIVIILPWNHKEEIINKLSFVKKWNCEIVTFIPEFEKN
jgi:SAM-dependent methyltransferase